MKEYIIGELLTGRSVSSVSPVRPNVLNIFIQVIVSLRGSSGESFLVSSGVTMKGSTELVSCKNILYRPQIVGRIDIGRLEGNPLRQVSAPKKIPREDGGKRTDQPRSRRTVLFETRVSFSSPSRPTQTITTNLLRK